MRTWRVREGDDIELVVDRLTGMELATEDVGGVIEDGEGLGGAAEAI